MGKLIRIKFHLYNFTDFTIYKFYNLVFSKAKFLLQEALPHAIMVQELKAEENLVFVH